MFTFEEDKFALSDHFAVEGELDMSRPFVPRKKVYEPSQFSHPRKVPDSTSGIRSGAMSFEFDLESDLKKSAFHF